MVEPPFNSSGLPGQIRCASVYIYIYIYIYIHMCIHIETKYINKYTRKHTKCAYTGTHADICSFLLASYNQNPHQRHQSRSARTSESSNRNLYTPIAYSLPKALRESWIPNVVHDCMQDFPARQVEDCLPQYFESIRSKKD